jgi:hypothetical protein
VKVGIVALDGAKVAAAASHQTDRGHQQTAQEILEEAGRIDGRRGRALRRATR